MQRTAGVRPCGPGRRRLPGAREAQRAEGKRIDTLIINAAECEPYITADNREAIENAQSVLEGVYIIRDLLHIDRVIIAVENNKPDVIETLTRIADNPERDPDDNVRVLPLRARYPRALKKCW